MIAATAFALVVARTVYRVGETAKGLGFPEKTTEGAKVLMDLVLESNDGAPMFWVPPHKIINNDDMTHKFFCSVENKRNGHKLTHTKSYRQKHKRSTYNVPGEEKIHQKTSSESRTEFQI